MSDLCGCTSHRATQGRGCLDVDPVAIADQRNAIFIARDASRHIASLDIIEHGFGWTLMRIAIARPAGTAHGIDISRCKDESFLRMNRLAVHRDRRRPTRIAAEKAESRM